MNRHLWLKMNQACLLSCFVLALWTMPSEVAGQEATPAKGRQLEWLKFSDEQFERNRFKGPLIIALMRDLCPGCKAKRDKLWSDKTVIQAVTERNMILFEGNAAADTGLQDIVKQKFMVSNLPVVIIRGKSMSAEPIIVPGIPDPSTIVQTLKQHVPLKKTAPPKKQ